MKKHELGFKFISLATCATFMFTLSDASPSYAVEGEIDESIIKVWDNRNFKKLPPSYSDRKPDIGDSIQPVAPKTDDDLVFHPDAPIAAYKASIAHVPCGSDNATTTLAPTHQQ